MYILDYNNAFFTSMGIFATREEAQKYIDNFGGDNKDLYTIVHVGKNNGEHVKVGSSSDFKSYRNYR